MTIVNPINNKAGDSIKYEVLEDTDPLEPKENTIYFITEKGKPDYNWVDRKKGGEESYYVVNPDPVFEGVIRYDGASGCFMLDENVLGQRYYIPYALMNSYTLYKLKEWGIFVDASSYGEAEYIYDDKAGLIMPKAVPYEVVPDETYLKVRDELRSGIHLSPSSESLSVDGITGNFILNQTDYTQMCLSFDRFIINDNRAYVFEPCEKEEADIVILNKSQLLLGEDTSLFSGYVLPNNPNRSLWHKAIKVLHNGKLITVG